MQELQIRNVRGFQFGKSALRKRRSGNADFKKRSRAAKKAARKSMGKRLAALRRFRSSAKFKQLAKARQQYHRMTSSQIPDGNVVTEAIIDYLIEGGSMDVIHSTVAGKNITINDLGTCIDAIMSELIDLGLNYNLVEVEVDEEEKSVFIYFNDQIGDQESKLTDLFSRYGKVSKFINPEDDPALGVHGYKIETTYTGGLKGKVEEINALSIYDRVARALRNNTDAAR